MERAKPSSGKQAQRRGSRSPTGLSKRGVVLIVVVSMLALFLLLGVSFALIASQYRLGARSQAEIERVGDDPRTELEMIFGQLLYDVDISSHPPRSSLGGQGLLRDMYGIDGAVFPDRSSESTANATAAIRNGGHVWAITFDFTSTSTDAGFVNLLTGENRQFNHFSGRVFTFTKDSTGAPINVSTRIFAYHPFLTGTTSQLLIEAPEPDINRLLTSPGFGFVINGSPFNGTGLGYDPYDRRLDADASPNTYPEHPTALLPNLSAYGDVSAYSEDDPSQRFHLESGGFDESYDAVDFQNPFLSMVPPIAAQQYQDYRNGTGSAPAVIPSFHRPELLNYWRNQMYPSGHPQGTGNMLDFAGSPLTSSTLLRGCTFRPNPHDHPNFTGSNSNLATDINSWMGQMSTLNPIYWDVDNDGDGMPDSVWIDPGLPVITAADGKRYKRLSAILIKDLDGRLNVNAHGNTRQLNNAYQPEQTVTVSAASGASASGVMHRGIGFGPAEVDLRNIFGGDYSAVLNGRYGSDGQPGIAARRDDMDSLKHNLIPDNYATNSLVYASPPDVWGVGAIAYHNAAPAQAYMGQANEVTNHPYEFNPYAGQSATDSPYDPVDLEAVLRYHDRDIAGVSSTGRLGTLTPNSALAHTNSGVVEKGRIGPDHRLREMITTISSHLPVPSAIVPFRMRDRAIPGETTVLDLYRARLMEENASVPGWNSQKSEESLNTLVPFEFKNGRRFNINRWLGNGQNEPVAGGRGVDSVDDRWEHFVNQDAWQSSALTNGAQLPAGFSGIPADSSNGGDINLDGVSNDNRYSREMFARNLYCLAMLFIDTRQSSGSGDPTPGETGITPEDKRKLLAERVAQWAINVVEFRDPDGVMTPFEFDYFPFHDDDTNHPDASVYTKGASTWDVDGVFGGAGDPDAGKNWRGVVWGVESPDLLLSESIAFHDRKVVDSALDDGSHTTGEANGGVGSAERDVADPNMRDSTLDQLGVPQGSLFIELYCTANNATPSRKYAQQAELFTGGNLNLSKVAPQGWPVWRIAISELARSNPNVERRMPFSVAQGLPPLASTDAKPHTATFSPERSSRLTPHGAMPGDPMPLDRYIWFASEAATGRADPNVFFADGNYTVAPGQYVVIGPRDWTALGSLVPSQAANPPHPDWGGDAPKGVRRQGGQFRVLREDGTADPLTNAANHVGIVADMSAPAGWPAVRRGVNISEPLPSGGAYYPAPLVAAGELYFDPVTPDRTMPDRPLDESKLLGTKDLLRTDSYQNIAAIYLQRLADPSQAFDQYSNPYITVDWSEIDLTVFSGAENTDRSVAGSNPAQPIDPTDPNPAAQLAFQTRRRDGWGQGMGNLWPPITDAPARYAANSVDPIKYFFKYFLDAASQRHDLGGLNARLGMAHASPLGEPQTQFPWISWHNRPFSNSMELLLVPSSSQSRLCFEFTKYGKDAKQNNVGMSPFASSTLTGPSPTLAGPVGHLLNFFQSDESDEPTVDSLQLQSILDCVEVPSPYMGADRWYNPVDFSAPYNFATRFRDPGRINLNTIWDPEIINSIAGQGPGPAIASKIMRSRRGYAGAIDAIDPQYPTIFSNPFRDAASGDLAPDIPSGSTSSMRKKLYVEATLLRPDPDNANKPLFRRDASVAAGAFDRTDDAYFTYQMYQKLGNIYTTRSNCFAVWITVGYFEVSDGTVDAAHPDGYYLGSEIGADSGEIERHRAFYLVDRSIPVGFLPGQKLNSDQCVLLKRLIE